MEGVSTTYDDRRALRGVFCLFGTAVCWSFMGILTKWNTQSPFLIGGVTSTIVLVFTLVVARPQLRFSPLIVGVGLASFFTGLTFRYANQLTTVGNAIVLQYTSMIFVIVYQSLAERRMPALRHVLVVLGAFAGMALFFMGSLSAEGMLGNLLAIASGASFGLQFYLNSRPGAAPLVSSLVASVCSMVPLLFMFDRLPQVNPAEWGYMAASGVFCSSFANILFSKGIGKVPAFTANLICMSEVIMAPTWSFFIFGETFSETALAGAALIVASIVVNLALDARARSRAAETSI